MEEEKEKPVEQVYDSACKKSEQHRLGHTHLLLLKHSLEQCLDVHARNSNLPPDQQDVIEGVLEAPGSNVRVAESHSVCPVLYSVNPSSWHVHNVVRVLLDHEDLVLQHKCLLRRREKRNTNAFRVSFFHLAAKQLDKLNSLLRGRTQPHLSTAHYVDIRVCTQEILMCASVRASCNSVQPNSTPVKHACEHCPRKLSADASHHCVNALLTGTDDDLGNLMGLRRQRNREAIQEIVWCEQWRSAFEGRCLR